MLSKERIREMEREKLSRTSKADKKVMEELLKMGFTYSYASTNHLHDVIVFAIRENPRDHETMRGLLKAANEKTSVQYGITSQKCQNSIAIAIERAFDTGNVEYMLEVFKSVYDYDRQTIQSRAFIATMRRKIMDEMEAEQGVGVDDLQQTIKDMVDKILDASVLTSVCSILMAVKGETI